MPSMRALTPSMDDDPAVEATIYTDMDIWGSWHIWLVDPVRRGDIAAIKSHLATGGPIHPEDNPDYDPFVLAAQRPDPEALRLLLDHHDTHPAPYPPDPEPNERGRVPLLHIACIHGAHETVRYLLDERPTVAGDLHAPNRFGHTPLLSAASSLITCVREEEKDMYEGRGRAGADERIRRCEKLVCMLLDRGARATDSAPSLSYVDATPESSRNTVLSLAIPRASRALLRRLIDEGADTSVTTSEAAYGALFARLGDEVLLSNPRNHVTLLHVAAYFANAEAVDMLLEAEGVDALARRDEVGRLPIHYAAMAWPDGVVPEGVDTGALARTLVGAPGLVDAQDERGYTPLHHAVAPCGRLPSRADFTLARFLATELGSSARVRGRDGRTALHCLCGSTVTDRDTGLVALLLDLDGDRGASIHDVDDAGDTPLHLAAEAGSQSVVEVLLARGADVHARNKGGQTPVHKGASARPMHGWVGRDFALETQLAAHKSLLETLLAGTGESMLDEEDAEGRTARQVAEGMRDDWRVSEGLAKKHWPRVIVKSAIWHRRLSAEWDEFEEEGSDITTGST